MKKKKPCNLSCNLLFFKEIKTATQNKGYIHMYTGIIVNHFLYVLAFHPHLNAVSANKALQK